MQRIQHIARSIMVAVLLCAGIFICVNDPGLNAHKVTGWNMALGGNFANFRQTGWEITQREMSMPPNSLANAALCFEESQRIVRK